MNKRERGRFELLGHDVWLRVGPEGREMERIEGRDHERFMDRLYLPSHTNQLTTDQIAVINRYREDLLARGKRLEHRERVRQYAVHLIKELRYSKLLEIGCGKFPLASDMDLSLYAGVDIDQEAVQENNRSGITTFSCLSDIDPSLLSDFDICLALFVFQFYVAPVELDLIASKLADNTVCVFNVATKDAEIRDSVPHGLSARGMSIQSASLDHLGVHDTLFVAYHEAGTTQAECALAIAKEVFSLLGLSLNRMRKNGVV